MVDLKSIRARTSTVREYVDNAELAARDIMLEKYKNYRLDMDALKALKDAVKGVVTVVFSASWCGDCKNAIPVLLHLEEKIRMNIRVFGTIKTAPLNPSQKWAVPPSPPEILEWNVTAIPWIEFFNSRGRRLGTIIEKPHVKESLEAEILYTLSKDR
ncbi:MAG: thioredoxin family protein [Candidatus Thorarchaeota archaeon]|nr:thioredoxin family protein [Candidatus Thorarchaeota archaeon]